MDGLLYVIIVLLFALLAYTLYQLVNCKQDTKSCPIAGPYTPIAQVTQDIAREPSVEMRDRAVLSDTLYPPVSRDTADNTRALMREPRLMPTRDSSDTYQLVGYLVNTTDKEDVWKLLARTTNRSQADFYAESSNRRLDLKVPLTSENARAADGSNTRPFRDVYDLPDAVTIQHPMFSKDAIYSIVRLPRSQLASGYY